jgi:hypothetical protein
MYRVAASNGIAAPLPAEIKRNPISIAALVWISFVPFFAYVFFFQFHKTQIITKAVLCKVLVSL